MMFSTRFRLSLSHVLLAMLVAYWLLLVVLRHVPHLPDSVTAAASMGDKAAHFLAYSGLAFLFASAAACHRRLTCLNYLFLFVVAAGYGAVDELTQMVVPHRQADWLDWLADLGGIAFGLLLHCVIIRMIAASRQAFADYAVPQQKPLT
jgi:VanZ family protein